MTELAKRSETNEKANYLADLILRFTDKAWVSFSDADSGWEHLEADIDEVRPLARAYFDLKELREAAVSMYELITHCGWECPPSVNDLMRKILEAK